MLQTLIVRADLGGLDTILLIERVFLVAITHVSRGLVLNSASADWRHCLFTLRRHRGHSFLVRLHVSADRLLILFRDFEHAINLAEA